MPSAREIRVRMNSIQQTRKITNAMYLISSAKLRKAKQEWDQTRPYFQALKAEVKRIFRTSGHVQSRYLYPDEGELPPNGTYGFLVITADKGLAGAYNQNVLKEAHRLLQEHPQTKLFVVGEYGRQYFQRHQVPIERSFLYTAQNPTMQRAREITAELLDRFDKGELQKIFVIYTDMKNSLTENVSVTRILPFHRSAFTAPTDEKRISEPFEFFPSVTQVLENIVPSYVSGFIYSALIDSFCSEQSARMNAMNSANENAEKMLGELALAYNRIRQAAITQEITEVSAGARAQKRKRQKQRAQGRES
ncbi:MAG: ATP synthase F1 subunit gamma [Candidatus Limiplasma sp.]|nr:ATP synthase F1 subunit gamma [Clostridiales bacterium]MDY4062764.1 ATP synthase F1 subunit gamma [Candidatus Limiplasma sp.]